MLICLNNHSPSFMNPRDQTNGKILSWLLIIGAVVWVIGWVWERFLKWGRYRMSIKYISCVSKYIDQKSHIYTPIGHLKPQKWLNYAFHNSWERSMVSFCTIIVIQNMPSNFAMQFCWAYLRLFRILQLNTRPWSSSTWTFISLWSLPTTKKQEILQPVMLSFLKLQLKVVHKKRQRNYWMRFFLTWWKTKRTNSLDITTIAPVE